MDPHAFGIMYLNFEWLNPNSVLINVYGLRTEYMYVGTHKVWDGLDTRAISVKVALTEFLRIWHECEFWWLWLRSPTPTPSQAPYPPHPSRSSPSLSIIRSNTIPSHPIPAVRSFVPSPCAAPLAGREVRFFDRLGRLKESKLTM